jgi:hypothetical protein
MGVLKICDEKKRGHTARLKRLRDKSRCGSQLPAAAAARHYSGNQRHLDHHLFVLADCDCVLVSSADARGSDSGDWGVVGRSFGQPLVCSFRFSLVYSQDNKPEL